MNMLAQIQNVDPSFLKQALLLIIGLLAGAASVAALLKKRRHIEPQPLEVKQAAEFVTVAACDVHRSDIIRRLDQQDQDRADLREAVENNRKASETEMRTRTRGIYEKLDQLRTDVNGQIDKLRGEMGRHAQDVERALGRIEGKLDNER